METLEIIGSICLNRVYSGDSRDYIGVILG